MEKTFQSHLRKEDLLLALVIGEEETRRNHLYLKQRLFRQALQSFQNVKTGTPTEGLNVLCQENLMQQAFTNGWLGCA